MAEIGALIRKQQSKFVETLAKKSHFSMSEVDGLLSVYRKLSEGLEVDRMDRTRFREFLHNAFDMTDDILLDRIFKRFDADNDGYVSREEWVYGLSVFLKGNEDQHIEYCFDIYDLNSDGFISREEMLNMLKTCLGRQGLEEDQDEGVKDLIEMTLRKMDIDKDGRISESDWTQTIKAEPLMLEAFGPCLPQRNAGEIFLEKCREAD
ncbi:calaxin-like [Tigriopus californicus]|uniref:calaxin-like n=1 Tax=Tigriopus californicus TaxID=6832 RepID=UPI0027DA47D3|nr:calaxin-like [Tigriopus californicus]